MSGIQEARGEGVTLLTIGELGVDIHDDMPGRAAIYTWSESEDGETSFNVEELRNLRRLIDEALVRLS